jgi:NAD(P)-dependent dehydrogenase (short-subunit alcohol dehydrogenase family)
VELMDLGDVRRVLEVNLIGSIALSQAFIPLLRKSQGRLIFVGSILGFTVMPLYGAYSARC